MDLTELTALQAGRLIAEGELSSVELTRACLDRIAARNPDVGAFRHWDPEFSLQEARAADAQSPKSPLHGVPFGVKDVIDTRDFPTECGTPIHVGRRPREDAVCVQRMRAAGAVLLGKLVTTEYALFHPNETRHPWNIDHTPGGSSSGTGAAVCDRMTPIAFGNQTAGSLIRPAAFCGVYGFKPTHGTVDGTGILPLQLYFDTLGYMARALEDIPVFYGLVEGSDQVQAFPAEQPPKIGLCQTHQWPEAGTDSRDMLHRAAEDFAARGAKVEPFALPKDYADLVAVHREVLYAGIAKSLDDDFRRAGDQMSESLQAVLAEGRAVTADQYEKSFARADHCRATFDQCLGDFDALLCPSAPGEAPAGMATGSPVFQVTWTLLGVPCLNLPVGTGSQGLPVGVQLIGRRYQDAALLALGSRLMRDHESIALRS